MSITKLDNKSFRITGAIVDFANTPMPAGKGLVKLTCRDVTLQDHYVAVTCRNRERVRNKRIAAVGHCQASIREDATRYINLKQDLTFGDGELETIIKSICSVYAAAKQNWEGGAE